MDEERHGKPQRNRTARRRATFSRWAKAQRNFGAVMFSGMAAVILALTLRALASAAFVNELLPAAASSTIPGILYACGVAGLSVGMIGIALEGYRFSRTVPGPGMEQVIGGAVLMTGMALLGAAFLIAQRHLA